MMLALALACAPVTIDLGDTTSGIKDGTGAATPSGTAPTENGTTPTETVTDTVTTDTTPEPVRDDAGDYVGVIDASLSTGMGWGDTVCSGEVAFSLDEAGVLEGDAVCSSDWSGFEGALSGVAVDGVIEGAWAVSFGWGDPIELAMVGEVADGLATLSLDQSLDWAEIAGDIEAERE